MNKARARAEKRTHLIDRVKVGSWWEPRAGVAGTNKGSGVRQIESIDASNPLDVRVRFAACGSKRGISAINLVYGYDPCDAPAPKLAAPPPKPVSPLNGAGEAIREIVRDEIRAVLAELRPIVREEARAALADAFGEGAAS